MELRQIRSFLSITETLHFGRTAELIHLSQPALSLQIRALEEEVGVRLLERNRRKTTLTAAGLAFRDDAAVALSQLEQGVRRARLTANGKLGRLRIGFISTAGREIVPDIVRQFRELNPEVEFSLRNILTAEQIRMLDAGALDIGFLRLPIGEHPALDVVTVHREPFVLVVPSSHKLAESKTVRLRELAGQDFVGYERAYAPGFHDLIFGILREAGIAPNVSQSAAEIPTLISLVASGMGVSILPISAVKHSVASVVACKILDRIPMSEIGIAVSKRFRAAVVDNFRSFALKKLGLSRNALHANRS
ncbi:LysR family transcriptional regulator [Acidicapsa acidisoli]|uniref:LysR family transcriptional regulator n=1 Tax=Acidicapsa acidisoli TaxID=1615681 RepID=UPI0021E0807B|nr:LysR family transcriptional regulator [Acidicapsa acidisoli]